MAKVRRDYTYRAGQKIGLKRRNDQFVVRVLPDRLRQLGLPEGEQMSSASTRVTCRSGDLERLMKRARKVAPTHHAYYLSGTDEEFLITDRIFVSFREPLPADQVDAFAGRYALVKREQYSDREYLFQLTDHTGMNPVKLVVRLNEKEPLVESAEHDLNYRMNTYQLSLPTDPFYEQQWHLHTRANNPDFDPRASSRCEDAWELLGTFGSSDVVVGLTDDGCRLDHLDFNSPGKFANWGYFRGTRLVTNIDTDANSDDMYEAGANHGTSCAGVIAGEADAVLTVGGAPGCRLLPIKWESQGPFLLISDSKLLTTLNYVATRVDVLSNSWGGVPTSTWLPAVTNRITELAQTGGRRGRGIIFLWAAGNENCPIEHTAAVDVPYTDGWQQREDGSWVWVGVQTARRFRNNLVGIPGVMHVAALASNAQRSHYSNYGTGISVCAPTSNGHAYFRLSVPGLAITTTSGSGGGVTGGFGGTSSATPLVAAVAALAISGNPELTALDVISILKRTASKDLSLQGYARTPPASFDPNPTWDVSPIAPFDSGAFTDTNDPDGTWSSWFGHGRIDAPEAIAEALRLRTDAIRELRFESRPGATIPDNNPAGVEDVIHVPDAGRLQEMRITIDITHSWIGDLRVSLISPDGSAVLLHNLSGASEDNIRKTYDVAEVPALASLRDRPVTGRLGSSY